MIWPPSGPGWWLIGALALTIAELIAPGFFLIFLAVGAGVTGAVLLMLPGGLPVMVEVVIFAAATAAALMVGRRWYRRSPVPTEDPLLNDRSARLVGEIVEVTEAIVGGAGRVRVGDGAWTARGPDTPAGARVRVVAATSGELIVEPT